jgi:hypothetical protein
MIFTEMAQNLLPDIFDRMKEINVGETPKIYFSGEFDSNQTKFEKASNQLKVGAIANNDKIGQALLRFTRYIIDDNLSLYYDDLSEVEQSLTLDNIIDLMAERESFYVDSFYLNETPEANLLNAGGEFRITNNLANVDIWTVPRVENNIDWVI